MKIKTVKTIETDRLILVYSQKLMQYVNSDNLRCRDSSLIEDAYHNDWFFWYNDFTYFTPPAASIRDGEIFFINGRHRAILLSRHLDQFPFLIGNIDQDRFGGIPKASSLEVLNNIKASDFEEHSIFCLPDLRFGDFKPA